MKAFFQKLTTLAILMVLPLITFAQCPMCRLTAERSDYAKSLNGGILYLLAFPGIITFGLAFFWYKNRDKFIVHEWDNDEQRPSDN